MRNYPLLRVGLPLFIGWAAYVPFGSLAWHRYPTPWIAVGLMLGELLLLFRAALLEGERG